MQGHRYLSFSKFGHMLLFPAATQLEPHTDSQKPTVAIEYAESRSSGPCNLSAVFKMLTEECSNRLTTGVPA
jgi:hypothetical protein